MTAARGMGPSTDRVAVGAPTCWTFLDKAVSTGWQGRGGMDGIALMSEKQHSEPVGLILAIEPDPETAAALRRTLGTQIRASLVVVTCIEHALNAISERIPDLILTSSFLPPADEKSICEHLKCRADASHTQILTLPQFVETAEWEAQDATEVGTAVVLRFRPKRPAAGTPRCDATIVRKLVAEYLDQANALRLTAHGRPGPDAPVSVGGESRRAQDRAQTPPPSTSLVPTRESEGRVAKSGYVLPTDRRRAHRRKGSELAGQWSIKLPGAGDARIVDLSRLGVLLETKSKLTPGAVIDLHLLGIEKNVSVAARLVRSNIANPTDLDTTYHVAAAFCHEIDILPAKAPAHTGETSHAPRVLGELLGRVLADANWVSNGPKLCSTFEEELRRLALVQQVRIGPMPMAVPSPAGCESMSFRIPGSRNARLRLHVIFERDHQPAAAEISLLRAAANLASVVLEFAPSARLHSPTI